MTAVTQKIDLYGQLAPPKTKPLTLIFMGSGLSLVLLGYLAVALYLVQDEQALKDRVATTQQQNKVLQQEVNEQQTKDAKINIEPLEKKLTQLRLVQRRQQLLIKHLSDPYFDQNYRFSDAMAGLARQHVPGVALEKFSVDAEGINFSMQGQLARPEVLPAYVKNLGKEAAFAAMTFDKVMMSSQDEGLSFELSSLSQTTEPPGESGT